MKFSSHFIRAGAALVISLSTVCAAATWQDDTAVAREQAQSYFEADDGRKAVATLIQAARKHPEDRLVGALLYSGVRDHVWHISKILPIQHKAPVTALVFSRDDSTIASGSAGGELLLSSMEPLEAADAEAKRVALARESGIAGLAFSRDGKRLAVATKEHGVQVIDVAQRSVVFAAPKIAGTVTVFHAASDADLVAIGSDQGLIQVVDFAAGKVALDAAPRVGGVSCLVLSRSGRKLAVGCGDRVARVWNVVTGQLIGKGVQHDADLRAVDLSYDERYVLSSSEAGIVRLSNPEEGILVMPIIQCPALVKHASISPDGSTIATMLDDGSVLFWDAFTGQKRQLGLREDGQFERFMWSRSGLRGITISDAGHASFWTLRDGNRTGETMPQGSPIVFAAMSEDSKYLATGSEDGVTRVWKTDGGVVLPTVRAHAARARAAFYSLDSKHLVTVSEDHTALHWKAGEVYPTGPAMKHAGRVTCATFNPDGTRILTCDDTGVAQLWDGANSKPDGAPYPHTAPINWVDFHPDGQRFLTASGDSARIWTLADRSAPVAVIRHPSEKSEIKCARFSPDGKWLVTASTDGFARVCNAATYQDTGVAIQRGFPVLCARFSRDGTRLVVGGEDGQAVVFETATWRPVGVPIQAPGPVFSAVMTADNNFVVISSLLLNAVDFFEVATGRAIGNGVPIPVQSTCVDYHYVDKLVVIACDDGTVRTVDSPFVTQDVPEWMINFAERLIGLKQIGPDTFERVDSHIGQLSALVPKDGKPDEDFFRLANWKLTMGAGRHGMPRLSSTLVDNIQRRLEDRSLDALFECYEAVSGDPRVLGAISLFLPNMRHGEYLADLVLEMPESDPLSRSYAAGTLIRSGRSQEALPVMAKAIADAPEDVRVIRRVAKLYARLLDKETSIALLEKALRLQPDSAETARSYGWALYNFHQPKEAAVHFRRAQEFTGDMVDDLIAGLCLCAAAQNNLPEAQQHFNRLVTLDPAWKEADYISALAGWSQLELGQLESIRRGLFTNR